MPWKKKFYIKTNEKQMGRNQKQSLQQKSDTLAECKGDFQKN